MYNSLLRKKRINTKIILPPYKLRKLQKGSFMLKNYDLANNTRLWFSGRLWETIEITSYHDLCKNAFVTTVDITTAVSAINFLKWVFVRLNRFTRFITVLCYKSFPLYIKSISWQNQNPCCVALLKYVIGISFW